MLLFLRCSFCIAPHVAIPCIALLTILFPLLLLHCHFSCTTTLHTLSFLSHCHSFCTTAFYALPIFMHCCSSCVVAFHVTSFHVVALIHSSCTIGSTTKILNFFKPEILVKKIRLGAEGGGGGAKRPFIILDKSILTCPV